MIVISKGGWYLNVLNVLAQVVTADRVLPASPRERDDGSGQRISLFQKPSHPVF